MTIDGGYDGYDGDPVDGVDHQTIETGEPIGVLVDVELPASTGFIDGLRRRIERRRLANTVTGLAWNGPIVVLLEMLGALFQLIGIEYRHEDAIDTTDPSSPRSSPRASRRRDSNR